MSNSLPTPAAPAQEVTRGVLAIPAFRKLWNSMVFSSLGDWLGLLATTALAQQLSGGSYQKANFAIAGVFIARLLPAVFLGPLAGVIADRFDRRLLMVNVDVLRGALYISIPIVHTYLWLYTAMILVECLTLFWSPAKEASVPNLVPKDKLESANQVSLLAAYGTAPIAAVLFSLLTLLSGAIAAISPLLPSKSVDIALYINALSFFFAAWTIRGLHEIPKGPAVSAESESVGRSLIQGWKAVASSKIIRGLILGMVGAFSAAGAVIGLARTFVGDLGGGDAAYGLLFASVFTGLALGIAFGPKVFAQFSRRRLFGASLAIAGFFLILLALIANLVISIFVVVILGAFSGICWVTGFTMLGMEVNNEVRGRTFAFVQSLIRITLVAVLAIAPIIAATIGQIHYSFYNIKLDYNGAQITILISGLVGLIIGVLSYRQMKDRPHVSLWSDILAALQGELGAITGQPTQGIFISFEGGEGTGKSTQSKLLAEWLRQEGEVVTLTFEPGGTDLGKGLRKILLGHETGAINPRAEALLYAADRAHHVETVIRPALDRDEVVINDRYMDSSIAYQGAGRVLIPAEVARINRWATETLYPTLTILIDLPAVTGLGRLQSLDRLEAEPIEFHERVRQEFLQLAMLDPERYLVVDGTQSVQEIHERIIARVAELPALKRNASGPHSRNILRPIIAASHAMSRATKSAKSTATNAASKAATKASKAATKATKSTKKK
jgi:dTMP kinase